jgi:site-specific DNA-methyltransferase (adenine-specific)
MTYQILLGNNLDILPTLADNSVDSIVTDPPYELGFMGKKWDSSGIAYSVELWQQCLRVLKPGGHLLSFGGTRTYHRVAVAIEDAGFELRDSIAWLYGSGFPKSMDVSKAIDKAAGAEREVIGKKIASPKGISQAESRSDSAAGAYGGETKEIDITAPSTLEAKQWEGWGTALKPAFEPVIVARKPIEGTVANNVLKWGTGGLNIDGSKIGTESVESGRSGRSEASSNSYGTGLMGTQKAFVEGRWPANIILDPYTAQLVDEQSGDRPGGNFPTQRGAGVATGFGLGKPTDGGARKMNDSGGASRFFYVAKASKRDRNEGLEELEDSGQHKWNGSVGHRGVGDYYPDGTPRPVNPMKNFHPTVKPTSLMEYLIKLVTPPNGTVLDPFTGSGSTGKAAILQGFDFIGIEMTKEYLPIIEGRLKYAEKLVAEAEEQEKLKETEKLF